MKLPTLIQYQPFLLTDELVLWSLVEQKADALRARVCALVEIESVRDRIRIHGVNIDGGTIELGEVGWAIRLRDSNQLLNVVRELAATVQPARFLRKSGAAWHVITLEGGRCHSESVDDWLGHLRALGAEATSFAEQIVLKATPLSDEISAEDVALVQSLVRLDEDAFAPRAHLGALHARLGRHHE